MLLVQLGSLALQVTEQVVAIQYFLPLHLLAVAVAVLVDLIVLEKQVALAVVAVTMGVLAVLEIHPQHLQAKVTMVEHLLADIMVLVAVAVHLPLAQQHPLQLLVALVVRVQPQASLVHR